MQHYFTHSEYFLPTPAILIHTHSPKCTTYTHTRTYSTPTSIHTHSQLTRLSTPPRTHAPALTRLSARDHLSPINAGFLGSTIKFRIEVSNSIKGSKDDFNQHRGLFPFVEKNIRKWTQVSKSHGKAKIKRTIKCHKPAWLLFTTWPAAARLTDLQGKPKLKFSPVKWK